MIIKTEIVSLDEFDEIGEFKMPLEKDYILNINISHELEIINKYAEENGFKPLQLEGE